MASRKAGRHKRADLVPVITIWSILSCLAMQAVGVGVGQYSAHQGTKAGSVVGLRVCQSHGGKGPTMKAVLQSVIFVSQL